MRAGNVCLSGTSRAAKERMMGKGLLLWLIGVPIPIILLLWLFFH